MKKYTKELSDMQLETSNPFEAVARRGAAQMLMVAMEAEIDVYMKKFGRSETGGPAVRNGFSPERTLLTGIGPIPVKQPRVDDRKVRENGDEGFSSVLLPKFARRSPSLDTAIPALYLRGISMKEMASALAALVGPDAANLSASVIQRSTMKWQEEYESWCDRDLSEKKYAYWFADAIHMGVRLEDDKACLLVIIGVNFSGEKELLGLMDGFEESAANWKELLLGMRRRGLIEKPFLGIGDGALGFWKALEETYPGTKTQRCWVHKIRNVLSKLPKRMHARAKSSLHEIMMAKNRSDAQKQINVFEAAYKDAFPKAVECLTKDRDALLAFYNFPAAHWQTIRTTNPIESTFATVRLRTAKTRGMGTRATALAMAFKLVEKAEGGWRRIRSFELIVGMFANDLYEDGVKLAT